MIAPVNMDTEAISCWFFSSAWSFCRENLYGFSRPPGRQLRFCRVLGGRGGAYGVKRLLVRAGPRGY